jgi:serine protease Do
MPTQRSYVRPAHTPSLRRAAAWLVAAAAGLSSSALAVSPARVSPLVAAVRDAAPAVVNIQGQKSVTDPAPNGRGPGVTRQVNGMGTGIVIDPRGYVLTNHHVVDGVKQINVTLAGGQAYVAQLVARDPETDLAVIRIRTAQPLDVIRIGTSSDLMVGESVVALGNAFGYEHTATSGIVSALHRNVQVNETQQYLDLVQTDASINPGNSGGPLMNVDGEMIGVNVAVRAGAQGIGFAIPVDKALDVATRLMSVEKLENHWHGITPLAVEGFEGPVTVGRIDRDSPAAAAGFRRGDELRQIGPLSIRRPLDVERALLGHATGDRVPVLVSRNGEDLELDLLIASRSTRVTPTPERTATPRIDSEFQNATWDAFGMTLEPAAKGTLRERGLPLDGGMRVVAVRPGSSADQQRVAPGDILIQIHRWYTTSEQDVRYVLSRRDQLANLGTVRFDIIRGTERFYGQMALQGGDGSVRR